jgi:hypothetical protein
MTVTRAKRIAQRQAFEKAGKIAPDRSETVHEFSDGWRVVRLSTAGDLRREGLLMRNCVAMYAGDTIITEPRGEVILGPLSDCDPAPKVGPDDLDVVPLKGRHVHASLYSLRDEANLPHLTWWARDKSHACGALGYHNAAPKQHYLTRFEQWAEAAEIQAHTDENACELFLEDVHGDAFGLSCRT